MRKTRNFLRRAGSAALALTLTVSLCQPAFAATKAPFSKDETVYAVMAADGSVTKTTVSEHLYNADGLAGVEDRSTLKNIVNTESFAESTLNGDTLVWNTDDTDVYYKGDTDRQLPISAKVTYTLDGRTAPLSELLGKSGHLVLTIDLTNHETGKVTVNGKERTIVTPLVTAVGVVLGDDASSVNAVNGLLESAAKSSVAAFVTLPGVKESLDGLLPEQVNGVAEYLQDSVTVEADVESLTAPQILLACAASAEALGQGDEVFDLDSLNDLTDGIAALNDAMNQLLDGASQLKAGAAQLAAGSLALLDGANQLDSGLGQVIFSHLTDELYESKIVYRTEKFEDNVRTFCMNPNGIVVNENTNGIITVNGHSYEGDEKKTENTNFALLVSKHFSEPFKDSNGYGESIARLSNMLGGGVIVQRFGDLVRGRRSTVKRVEEGLVRPTLTATPGDLSLVLPKRILDGIIEMIYALDKVAPGTANDDTLLYGVEVKFYNMEVEIDDNLESCYKGLYVIGDGSGVTHSLSHASASGIYVARHIAEQN